MPEIAPLAKSRICIHSLGRNAPKLMGRPRLGVENPAHRSDIAPRATMFYEVARRARAHRVGGTGSASWLGRRAPSGLSFLASMFKDGGVAQLVRAAES